NTLQAVQMLSLSTTYACGYDATFIRTTDGGDTWDVQSKILGLGGRNFFSLSFLDANFGMVCGDSGKIIKTTDGGKNWVLLPTNTQTRLNSIVVIDQNIAIVVGDIGTILRTLDGGQSWQLVGFEVKTKFVTIRKLRPDFLTVVGLNGSLYKSTDLGKTWNQIPVAINGIPVANDFYGQVFIDDSTATLIGNPGEIVHTTDAGKTWTKQVLNDTIFLTAALTQVDGKDPNILAMVGDYGTVVSTTDGGSNWYRRRLDTHDSLRGLSFYDKLNATAVGRDGIILQTSDGGTTWEFLPRSPLNDPLSAVAFPKGDTSFGIAVGYFGAVLRTVNGGTNWLPVQTPTNKYLKAVCFLDPITLIAVGEYGTMIKSTDAGLSWKSIVTNTSKHLYGVSFPTPLIGWAVGDSGIMLNSTDGGLTWVSRLFKRKLVFTCVVFPDSLYGYVGSGGWFSTGLYTTTDGGMTWNNPVVSSTFKVIAITAASNDFVALLASCPPDAGGALLISRDSGNSWQAGNAGGYAVHFPDEMHGTVVGNAPSSIHPDGTIGHSKDGGILWVIQHSPVTQDLKGVFYGTKQAGTAVGLRGQIIRVTTDE
ncbi:MAG: YCF48-related protein, partial [Ignavibacteriota bacterium]